MPLLIVLTSVAVFNLVDMKRFNGPAFLLLAGILSTALFGLDWMSLAGLAVTEAQSLYFTAHALQIMLAIAVAFCLFRASAVRGASTRASAVTICATSLALTSLIALSYALKPCEQSEWQCNLTQGMKAARIVSLTADRLKAQWALVIFDGNADGAHAVVSVNGRKINSAPEPLYSYFSDAHLLKNYQIFAGVSGKAPDQLRQWRAVQVPLACLKPGDNELSIVAPEKMTLFGSYDTPGGVFAPDWRNYFSATQLAQNPQLEPRLSQRLPLKCREARCTLEDRNGHVVESDLSLLAGVQSGQYRIMLLLGSPLKSNANLDHRGHGTRHFTYANAQVGPNKPLRIKQDLKITDASAEQLAVKISGTVAAPTSTHASVQCKLRDFICLGSDIALPGLPNAIAIPKGTGRFDVLGTLPAKAFIGPGKALETIVLTTDKATVSNLDIEISESAKPDIATSQVGVN